ncbi:spindle pole body component [Hirsutella rhossiliensis]|uniref:Spindle pole body component n=1 Tax=Hirsutella rhossiliensis TaxID=111463 RepID=A0A9P8SKX2_9HYPO|nr:spc97 / spc98 family domain-containing protein [Hirsutella rhossiliensis]KAH0965674.1 spc97 / spc98 family domain-containing protein [Hirsutella rhossiliensis]
MSSGGTRAPSRANGYGDERSRLSGANTSFRSERTDAKGGPSSSSQPGGAHSSATGTAHKRSASGNPRSATQPADERRYEERRVTERTYEAHVERVRTTSPEKPQRRTVPVDKRPSGLRRQKSSEWRPKEPATEPPQAPWNPEVTLLPRTSAPLASRVSIPPLASTVPQAPQPTPLGELSLEVQEAAIVEDLLFVFMGYEGQYIRYAKGFDSSEERDRLSGPSFRILPGLDPSLHDLTKSMLKMATYYSALVAFGDVQSREDFGAVNHALCASVRRFLQDYLIMIAQLETQFLTSDTFTIHVLNIQTISTSQMMLQLYSLAQELLKRNALLDDESEEDDDESEDDYDKVIERLTDGGDLLSGNMTGKKICKGGVVLGILTKRLETMSGDPAARALLTSLLRDASRPYMVMLNEWLHHGAINDPNSEFLIKEQKSIRRERLEQDYTDEYWERRYTIRDHDVPPQLDGVKDKVLLAGKYLNVVRECGGVDVSKVVADVPTSFDDSHFLDNVNNAYAHANESLMQLLLTTHALPARLQSMKHYFFLDPSDYFSYFLELGSSELRKPVKSVNTGKLQSLLDLVLRQPGSIVSLDPFKEDVKVEMNEVTLIKSLQRVVNITGIEQGEALQPLSSNQPTENDKNATGFTSLQLDYAVPFPVSLVISRKTVWRYQALFRYLLSLRYLESQLSATWQTQTRGVSWAHKGSNRALEIWKRRAWTLRARMLVFVQQLLYFCTAEVIEPNWTKFMTRLQPGDGDQEKKPGLMRTVDELMQDHVDFLDTCLKECMLTNSKLLRIHSKLMQTCTIFAAYTNWLTRELEKSDPDLSGATRPSTMTADQWRRFQASRAAPRASASSSRHDSPPPGDVDARVGNLSEIIRKWESNFSRHLQILLDALNHYAATETVVLLSLCARLSTANQGTEYAGLRTDEEVA